MCINPCMHIDFVVTPISSCMHIDFAVTPISGADKRER